MQMEILQFNLTGRGQPEIAETVYDSLHGFLHPACSLPWVEMVFQPGHPSHDNYEQMLLLKERIAMRLGHGAEDSELEKMTDCSLAYAKAIALEMFRYGQIYQKMLDHE